MRLSDACLAAMTAPIIAAAGLIDPSHAQQPIFRAAVDRVRVDVVVTDGSDRPIADLNLSVRARKCMVRLGISTIGELVRRTGDDLLECKNFGVTSLNEVREKLTIQNLKLRGD